MAARRRTTADVAPVAVRGSVPDVRHLIPSARSLVIGLTLALLAVGAYLGARDTSVFAVQTIDVRGGTPELRTQVRESLAGEIGRSLFRVSGGAVADRVDAIPGVRSFTYDRSFPHTLRVVVKREVPVLVVRRVPGRDAFLVGAGGRVIRMLPHPRLSHLPRLWVTKAVDVQVGQPLPPELTSAATSLAPLRGAGLPGGVAAVHVGKDELTLQLGGGLEVRLGNAGDLRLKLAIARRILEKTGAAAGGTGYLDVSVPLRPVLSTQPQVEG
ncbi:MAG TPA: FtsQ-type POTRA domain-containing protein [Gaiellaceae bacterium]|nr:FtsQ-type POTRA domain-containing protein [Gaiellaceae bacterium]